jgi:hypothetical protein
LLYTPWVNIVGLGLVASGVQVVPKIHKGKGVWGYSASDENQPDDFWDHDATGVKGTDAKVIFDRKERLGLWLLRGNRSTSTALDVGLLANKQQSKALSSSRRGKGKEPGIQITIKKNLTSGPYVWDLTMDAKVYQATMIWDHYNQWMQAQGARTAGYAAMSSANATNQVNMMAANNAASMGFSGALPN